MYKNLEELMNGVQANRENAGELYRINNLMLSYFDDQEEAKTFGFVGVGCITYAENKLIIKQRNYNGQ